jgi:hypothetical protein
MFDGACDYLVPEIEMTYRYNALTPIKYALECCRDIIAVGCSLTIDIVPVCNINPHLRISEDYELDCIGVMCDIANNLCIPINTDRLMIRKEDAQCISAHDIQRMHDIGNGMMGLKSDESTIRRIKKDVIGDK